MNQNQIKKYTSGSSFTCTVSVVISLIHLGLLASNLQTSDYYEMALFNESNQYSAIHKQITHGSF